MSSLEFGLNFFNHLSNDENKVFSPFSLTTCLSMVLMGTGSTSLKQLSKEMFGKIIKEKEFESLAKDLKKLFDKCFDDNSNAIISTNLMYPDSQFEVLPQFKRLIENYFSSKVKELDFQKNIKHSLVVINSDISEATNGKIHNILQDLSPLTVMVLVNALYFKGLWKSKFDKDNTKPDKFVTNLGEQIDVQMMHKKSKQMFGSSKPLKCRAVQLYYENTNAVMIVLLPDTDYSLEEMRDKLSVKSLNELVRNLSTVEVDLYLPKFKIESTYDLIPPLENTGIIDIFDENKANFSNLSPTKGVYVSQVIQKVVIEVNEEGTEAAAATVATMTVGSMPMKPPKIEIFRVDRPFMYLLVNQGNSRKIESILFVGQCCHPNTSP